MKTFILILFIISSFIVQAQPALVKELPAYNKSINPVKAAFVSGTKYFYVLTTMVNDKQQNELWVSDGTAAGTQMLKSTSGEIIGAETVNNQFIFLTGIFAANGNDKVFDVWKTDGSVNGTQLIKQEVAIGKNAQFEYIYRPNNFTVVNNQLFFIANGRTNFQQLWKTDGSVNGTLVVKNDFDSSIRTTDITDLVALNNQLLFIQRTEIGTINHSILFTSDGSYSGTKEIASSSNGNFINADLSFAIKYNDKLIFTATDVAHGSEPWITDGTVSGTSNFLDGVPGPGSSFVREFELIGDKLFTIEAYAQLIAVYNLTNHERTELGSGFDHIYEANILNNKIFFKAISKVKGLEWYTSDGSVEGTHILKDIREGAYDGLIELYNPTRIAGLSDQNKYFFFSANDGIHGTELWYYNSATDLTSLYTDIAEGAAWSLPDFFKKAGEQLFFTAYDKNKWQLYRIDLNNIHPLASNYKPLADGEWLQSFGPEQIVSNGYFNFVEGISSDSKGNLYIPGRFLSNKNSFVFFDSDTVAAGNPNYAGDTYKDWLVKLGSDGKFKWFRSNGGNDFFGYVATTVDNSDNIVYAAGALEPVVFGNQVINQNGVYAAKYDSSGNLLWYRIYSAGPSSRVSHVTTTSTNEILLGGAYKNGFIDMGNGVSQTSPYSAQYFVAKTSTNGDPQWVTNIPTHVGYEGYIKKIIQDKLGNNYVLTTLFGPYTSASGCVTDTTYIQISKLSDKGRLLWNKKLNCVGVINALSLNIDAAGLLNIGGYYYGEAFIDGYRIGYNYGSVCSGVEIIQVTLRTGDGKVTGLGHNAYTNLSILDIKANKDGSYYLLGHQNNTNITSKLPGFEASPYSSAEHQLVLQHRLYDGKIIGEKKWNLSSGAYFNRSYFTLDQQNNFILTTCGSTFFDTIPNSIANNNVNAVVWKHINRFSTPKITTINSRSEIKVLNNPSGNNIILSLPGTGITGEVNVYNASGQLVIRKTINASLSIINIETSSLPMGVYFVKVPIGDKTETVKFLKR